MLSQDKLHELITAAVQRITIPGSEVTHNEKVGNRQFDVMVRVRLGLHTVLMAYEVKDKKRRTPVETVDAFVTKARDIGADKAVIVSTSGFQSGAVEAAQRHGVDLFSLTLVADALPRLKPQGTYVLSGTPESLKSFKPEMRIVKAKQHTNAIREVRILFDDGTKVQVPGEASQMQHCLGTSTVRHISLIEHIERGFQNLVPVGKSERRSIVLAGSMDTFDEMFVKRGFIKSLDLLVEGVEVDVVDGNYRIDLTSVGQTVIYQNALTNEKFERELSDLPIGFEDFKIGEYYFTINPLRYFFCSSVAGDSASLILVESFQLGKLVQWEFKQSLRYSRFYLPVEDDAVLGRLRRRLQKFRALKMMTGG